MPRDLWYPRGVGVSYERGIPVVPNSHARQGRAPRSSPGLGALNRFWREIIWGARAPQILAFGGHEKHAAPLAARGNAGLGPAVLREGARGPQPPSDPGTNRWTTKVSETPNLVGGRIQSEPHESLKSSV